MAEGQATPMSEPGSHACVVLSTYLDRHGEEAAGTVALRPDEGVVVAVR